MQNLQPTPHNASAELPAAQAAAPKRYPTLEELKQLKEETRRVIEDCRELGRDLKREIIRLKTAAS